MKQYDVHFHSYYRVRAKNKDEAHEVALETRDALGFREEVEIEEVNIDAEMDDDS